LALTHYQLALGPDHLPHVRPYIACRFSQSMWVSFAETGDISVVVELSQIPPPPDKHGITRIKHDPNGGMQGCRPMLGTAKWGATPVRRTDQFAHLPATRDKCRCVFFING